ncbi:serine hydrolase [Kamptonema sp. UHCC 0994]|uniref:serine hydrolase n=1 Tax=Kamptonema sp. UHCC 0994 TaxID=3031329 RepID=UPI0023B8CFA3|nr:serine hydrolase [Kamptonema sp. UHCC 0994]MDF0555068.1 class A beta-lactamase-related serine hydrolase [Kamptonema sp. UHCC 0994]
MGAARLKLNLTKALAIAIGIGLIQIATILKSTSQPSNIRSLPELYQMRDRLIAELENPSPPTQPSFFSSILPQPSPQTLESLRQNLQIVEVQIISEQRANDNWEQAISRARQASEIGSLPNQSITTKKQAQFLWQQALNNLREIPQNSFQASKLNSKIQEYKRNLDIANDELNASKSEILGQIALESGLSKEAMISVCRLSRNCIHLRGNKPPRSPASLIKVPVAVALMHKITQEKININQEVYVNPGNYTEDASEIQSSKRYPLKILVEEMIDHSSNIATNELMDYLGTDYINQVLENRGYQVTRVNSKLMGERTMPFNVGSGPNRMTSNELTEMMLQIYNHEMPGNSVLIDALSRQYDRKLGFAALQGTQAKWLGEKTGENSLVLGTTLAMSIDGEGYIITVIDNRSGSDLQIRQCIAKIADYIVQNKQLF